MASYEVVKRGDNMKKPLEDLKSILVLIIIILLLAIVIKILL